ncbi:helix-turn-helix domain-containing protein [Burkholderia ubonensis]|nr:helix-turn-helix domain-containing protein [Burkholderia ubonensis]
MQRRKVTAAALGVHPNTLDHRLERIENTWVSGSITRHGSRSWKSR